MSDDVTIICISIRFYTLVGADKGDDVGGISYSPTKRNKRNAVIFILLVHSHCITNTCENYRNIVTFLFLQFPISFNRKGCFYMYMRNQDVRTKQGFIPSTLVADRLGVGLHTYRKWLNRGIKGDKKFKILKVIEGIKRENGGE